MKLGRHFLASRKMFFEGVFAPSNKVVTWKLSWELAGGTEKTVFFSLPTMFFEGVFTPSFKVLTWKLGTEYWLGSHHALVQNIGFFFRLSWWPKSKNDILLDFGERKMLKMVLVLELRDDWPLPNLYLPLSSITWTSTFSMFGHLPIDLQSKSRAPNQHKSKLDCL